MRIHICAVGRLRSGPEQQLIDDYLKRFERTGRALGFSGATVHEVDERKAQTMGAQGDALRRAIPKNSLICALDERGRQMTSPEFAKLMQGWADRGQSDVSFVIGGADGIAPDLRAEAGAALSFGAMVWPHMLARVMLTEQLYRAATILAGSPYHRA